MSDQTTKESDSVVTGSTGSTGATDIKIHSNVCSATTTKTVVIKAVPRKGRIASAIPDYVLSNKALNEAIATLPRNYNFEVHKSVWKIKSEDIQTVALQFPEGLLMYSCVLADIIRRFTGAKVIILGDVTYGACCIDDFSAQKLGAQLLIHYGHSCLVPVNTTRLKVLYVFVEISFETDHLIATIETNFPDRNTRFALMGTIQFSAALHDALEKLKATYNSVVVPQAKPLSPGETLGCTAPVLPPCDALIFVADGRFHLEAAMIQNPSIPSFRYDPYGKTLTREGYDVERMREIRFREIVKARGGKVFGIIMGTLGRQGSPRIFQRMKELLLKHDKRFIQFLMAEIQPQKLAMIDQIDVWIQVACPRLSIDWGSQLKKPLLTPYELCVALEEEQFRSVYPMDYYSKSGGIWSNYI